VPKLANDLIVFGEVRYLAIFGEVEL
jgi:hypothetical protein